jgi:dehydrogenase/reductase SDR family protein 12
VSAARVFGNVVDKVIEAPVVTSFTNIGYHVRSRVSDWDDLSKISLSGRTVVVTGGTSGLGLATAEGLATLGAHVVITGRKRDRASSVAAQINQSLAASASAGVGAVSGVGADMGELDEVRALADELLAAHPAIDVLIHNAGALTADRRENSAGIEATVASQVLGPFLLTSLLLPTLGRGDQQKPGRVLTMSSGGMYSAGLTVSGLEMTRSDYKGSEQYARAKRAQVTLNEMWADRVSSADVVFHAMHPGWADTPGVEESLPKFRKILGPFLRSPDQGADTMLWLAADDEPAGCSGEFWLDRTRRSIHKLPSTKRTDTPERRMELWNRCVEVTGASIP